jgi:hypothetical protein
MLCEAENYVKLDLFMSGLPSISPSMLISYFT